MPGTLSTSADLRDLNPFVRFDGGVNTAHPEGKTTFKDRRNQQNVYLRKEHLRASKREVEVFIRGVRDFLGSLGFVEERHDSEATVFRNVQHGFEVLLHHWQGALKKGEGLPDCPRFVPANKVAQEDVDTAGWAIAMRGGGPFSRGITSFVDRFFPEMTPVETDQGSTVYSLGHPVFQECLETTPIHEEDQDRFLHDSPPPM